ARPFGRYGWQLTTLSPSESNLMTSVTSRGPSLGRRLTAAFGATLCLALFGSGYGAYALNESAAQTRAIVEQDVATERLVAEWYRNVAMSVRRTTAIAVSADPSLADFFAADAGRAA